MAGRRISHQQLFTIQQQFQLDQHHSVIKYVLYFSILIGFSCRLTEHRIPPQRQAISVGGNGRATALKSQSIQICGHFLSKQPDSLTKFEAKDFSIENSS